MSVKVMHEVWQLELSVPEKFVLLALGDHAHDDGSNCFPSVSYVARKTGYSTRQVQRMLRRLESQTLIVPVANKQGGRGMATQYLIAVEKGVRLSPFPPTKRVTPATERVAPATEKGDIAMSPQPSVTVREPSITPSSSDGFEKFWQVYPKKEGKKKAIKAWKKLKLSNRRAALEGLHLWKRSRQWNRNGGQYIPHASTFVNDELWKERPHDLTTGGMNEQLSVSDRFANVGRKAAKAVD